MRGQWEVGGLDLNIPSIAVLNKFTNMPLFANNIPSEKIPCKLASKRPKMKDKFSISQKLHKITVFNIHTLQQLAVEIFRNVFI